MKTFQEDNDFDIEEIISPSEVKQAEDGKWPTKKDFRRKDLEITILHDILKKEEPSLAETLEVASDWIEKGYAICKVLKILGISPSTT